MSETRRLLRAIGAVATLGLGGALGCGSGEEPAAPEPAAAPAKAAAVRENRPPVVKSVLLHPSMPVPGTLVSARVEASDPDGDDFVLAYHWRLGGERYSGGESSLVVPETLKKGTPITVQVVARDGRSESGSVGAATRVANRPPEMLDLMLQPAAGLTVAAEIEASPRARDPDGDPIEFTYRWRVNGRPVPVSGSILTADHFKRGSRITLEVTASDGRETSEPLRSPEIEVVNALPRIVSHPSGLDETSGFRYRLEVEDPDGEGSLRFKLVEGPPGMILDWLSGEMSWEPGEDQSGVHPVVVEVKDAAGGVTTQSFEIDVAYEAASQDTPASPAP